MMIRKALYVAMILCFVFSASCMKTLSIDINTKNLTAVIDGGVILHVSVPCKMDGDVLHLQVPLSADLSLPLVEGKNIDLKLQSFLDSLREPEFGFTLSKEAILDGRVFSQYLVKLGAVSSELFYSCSIEQRKKLLDGMIEIIPFIVYQYLTYPEECRNYFNDAINGVITIIDMLSNMRGDKNNFDTAKLITLDLIKQEQNLLPKVEQNVEIQRRYDENIVNRIIKLLMSQKVLLNARECKEIVSYLDDALMIRWSLLSDLYTRGMSSLLNRFEMHAYIDLQNGVEFLEKVKKDIEFLKKSENAELLYYVAVLYCLSNMDNIHFPLSICDAYSNSETQAKKQIQILSRDILSKL